MITNILILENLIIYVSVKFNSSLTLDVNHLKTHVIIL